jgi:hypothetical protein
VAAQQFRHLDLAQAILPNQRLDNPGVFQLSCPAAGAIQPVDSCLGGALIGLQQPGGEMREVRQAACRAQALESIDQFVAFLAPAHHHRGQLPIALQRPRHGPFRLREVESITAVVFTDLVHGEGQRTLLYPAQHRRLPDLESKKRERRKPP